MKHFLLVYDRRPGTLVAFQEFDDIARANEERLRWELAKRANLDREVVVISSESKEHLKKTHSRYFQSLGEVLADLLATVSPVSAR